MRVPACFWFKNPILFVACAATLLVVSALGARDLLAEVACEGALPRSYDMLPTGLPCFLPANVVGDWNEDGHQDLLTYCHSPDPLPNLVPKLSLYLGSAAGLVPAPDVPAPATPIGPWVQTLDLNGDGSLDLVNGGRPPVVWYGRGDGTFELPVPLALPATDVDAIWAIDLNGDGRQDLVALLGDTSTLVWDRVQTFLADGAGGFVTGGNLSLPETPTVRNVHVADLNQDGLGDLVMVIGLWEIRQLLVYLGDGTGSFGTPTSLSFPSENQPKFVVGIEDWDGDHDLDLLVHMESHPDLPHPGTDRYALYPGTGDGTFADPWYTDINTSTATQTWPWEVTTGDVNGDSVPDMVYRRSFESFQILFGQVGGSLGPPQLYPNRVIGSAPRLIQAVGDAALDLVSHGSEALLVMENTRAFDRVPVAPIPRTSLVRAADLNGDGLTDFVTQRPPRGNSSTPPPDTISVYHLAPTTSLSAIQDIVLPVPPGPAPHGYPPVRDLALRDLDGDGRRELLVLRGLDASRADVSVFAPAPNGSFLPPFVMPFEYVTGEYLYSVLTGDMTGDGITDVLILRLPDTDPSPPDLMAGISLSRGIGDGTLEAPVELFRSFGLPRPALADVNADGHVDLIAYEYLGPVTGVRDMALTVRLGTGAGGFGPMTIQSLVESQSLFNTPRLHLGDVDGDGRTDAVVTRVFIVGDPNYLHADVFLGKGDGTFSAAVTTSYETFEYSTALLTHLDQDGRADLVIARGPNTLRVLCGQSDGTFSIGPPIVTGPGPASLFAGSMDGDTATDVIVLSNSTALVFHRNLLASTPSIAAQMRIVPPVIQPRSMAPWIQVTIELPAAYGAADIDVGTIRLNGEVPIQPKSARLGDEDGDGARDLTVTFASEFLKALPPGPHDAVLTGRLHSGEPFEAHSVVIVLPAPGRGPLTLRVASPLGATPVMLAVSGSLARERTIRVFDVHGRLVRTWKEAEEADHPVIWDGRDGHGSAAPSGVYFTRMTTTEGHATARTVLLR